MNTTLNITHTHEKVLIWAIISSIILHILFFVLVPNIKFDAIKKAPDVLKVEIVQPKKLPPQLMPEPPKPEAAKPIEKLKPEPKPEPIKPTPIKPLPKAVQKTLPEPTQEITSQPVPIEPPARAVIAAAPKNESPPIFIAPQAEPVKEKLDNDDAFNAAKSSYRSSVQKEIQRNLRYPKIAQERHISGVAKVEIVLDGEGNISAVNLVSSSGNNSLDAEAVAVINRSSLQQYMVAMLKGKIDRIIIPVSFALPDE
ncbi:MAG: energy transducer TonB [Bdellovibrio sp.]|nr:energy transducer TonB [Methylotenera sp.]